ncbi:prepilin-type N-terminal cleavage/methylation domain-containing protein [Metaplanococcus flavidus]|uniref:Prepilin-type N-terminal cleavage/methylation domain-containing protein n=1 Tax=Metaplanococcus flavidus TaxID=569883 RepID=A0ABW3LB69_9BACL
MKNERGITLVELIAALAIIGIITVVIASVLMTGTSSADRTSSKQQMQQEANYIVEVIRAEYLKKENNEIKIKVNNAEEKLIINNKVISQGYKYTIEEPEESDEENTFSIDPNENVKFEMVLIDGVNKPFPINTTFSKLR